MTSKTHLNFARTHPYLTKEIKTIVEKLEYPDTLDRRDVTDLLESDYNRIITRGIKQMVSFVVQIYGYEIITNRSNPRVRYRRVE